MVGILFFAFVGGIIVAAFVDGRVITRGLYDFIMGASETTSGFFDSVVADAIGGAIVVGGTIVFGLIIYWWRRAHPFYMRFVIDPYVFRGGYERKHWLPVRRPYEIGIGYSQLLIRLKPNKGASFERVGIRVVRKRWIWGCSVKRGRTGWIRFDDFRHVWGPIYRPPIWTYKNTHRENKITVLHVIDLEIKEIGKISGHRFEDWDDHVGGRWAEYIPPYLRTEEDSLWLCVRIKATEPDRYHLQFQGNLANGHRGYSRRDLHVKAEPNPRIANYRCQEASATYPERAKDCPDC